MVIVFLILIIGCACAVIYSIRELLTFIRVKKSGHLVQGKIIDFTEDRSGEGVTYPGVVSYTTISGEKVIATSKSSSGIKPSIGKEVWVVYSSSNPSHFYFQRSNVPFLMVSFILMFGVAMILLIVELCKVV